MVAPVVVGMLFLAVFPARTYLRQRHSLSAAKARLHVLAQQNTALDKQVKKLHTDSEIERLARQQYNLVRPGEEAYAILPSRQTPSPAGPAQNAKPKNDPGWLSRTWHSITSIF